MACLRAAIAEELRENDGAQRALRMVALLLLEAGCSVTEVSGWIDRTPRTLERWLRAYVSGGVAALGIGHGGGRRSGLTPAQAAQLESDLRASPAEAGYVQRSWTGKLLAAHLGQNYGVCLGERQCQRLLRHCFATRSAAPATRVVSFRRR